MRNALSSALCILLFLTVRGDAQSLSSFFETPYHTPEGVLLGMPGLEAPAFKSAPLPIDVPRRPGRVPDALDVLVTIGRDGRVKPRRVVGANGSSPAVNVNKLFRERVFVVLRSWSFEPGRLRDKPVDVAAILSVPFATDHPISGERKALPADFAPGALSDRDHRVLPSFCRMSAPPQYGSPEAMKAHIDGQVEIAFVVEPNGRVGDTRITKSLDSKFGLDALSVSSLKSWVFEPAVLDGKPVATSATAVMSFNLR